MYLTAVLLEERAYMSEDAGCGAAGHAGNQGDRFMPAAGCQRRHLKHPQQHLHHN